MKRDSLTLDTKAGNTLRECYQLECDNRGQLFYLGQKLNINLEIIQDLKSNGIDAIDTIIKIVNEKRIEMRNKKIQDILES